MTDTTLPPVEDVLAEFASGKVPRAQTWQILINGLYVNTEQVNNIESWHSSTAEMFTQILATKTEIETRYGQIEIWHGDIDAWQQAVSQNTAITEANKTASETLKDDTEAAASAAAQSERNAGEQATVATTEAARAIQAKNDAETAESNAAASQRASAESAGQSSASATAAANASATAVQAKEAAEAAATDAEASKTAAQSSASAASASQAAAKNSETRASNEADRSKLEADRSHNEADRAERAAGSINDIPDQTGHGGQFLGTDGTTADWQPIPEGLPPQTGNDGKFLQTDGTDASWQEVALGVPVGTFLPLGMKATTMGYLAADGQQYTKADYPALWDVAHKNQWEGVTDTTFIVPDWRGLGVTGYDPTGIIDPDNVGRGFLTKQTDAIRKITGRFENRKTTTLLSGVLSPEGAFSYLSDNPELTTCNSGTSSAARSVVGFDTSKVVPTATINRINNTNPLWVVKAYDVVLEPEQLQAKAVIDQVNANSSRIGVLEQTSDYALIDFGTASNNTRYVKPNPFGNNTPVICEAEVLINAKWANPNFIYSYNGDTSYGVVASYVKGEGIIAQTGKAAVKSASFNSGGGHGLSGSTVSAPCRVHVWRVGI